METSKMPRSGQEPDRKTDVDETDPDRSDRDNALGSVESQLDTLTDLDPTIPELQILTHVESGIDEAMGFNPYDTAAFSDKRDAEKS